MLNIGGVILFHVASSEQNPWIDLCPVPRVEDSGTHDDLISEKLG